MLHTYFDLSSARKSNLSPHKADSHLFYISKTYTQTYKLSIVYKKDFTLCITHDLNEFYFLTLKPHPLLSVKIKCHIEIATYRLKEPKEKCH